jgi:hypothetical protein
MKEIQIFVDMPAERYENGKGVVVRGMVEFVEVLDARVGMIDPSDTFPFSEPTRPGRFLIAVNDGGTLNVLRGDIRPPRIEFRPSEAELIAELKVARRVIGKLRRETNEFDEGREIADTALARIKTFLLRVKL